MSLTDVVSSTVSTVINNIIIVVNEGSRSPSNSSFDEDYDEPFLGNHRNDNTYNRPSSDAPLTRTIRRQVEQGVAQGLSQVEINTVISMLVIFSVFGCLGNGLVLYVFTKKNDKVTSTIFILALAWTDFLTCLIIMPYTAADILLDSHLHLDILCKAYQFLITSNVPLSAFIMVAIAVDRYFSICHPFMRVVTPRRARISIICLVMVAFTLGTITACLFTVRTPLDAIERDTQNNLLCCNETLNASFRELVHTFPQNSAQTSDGLSISNSHSVHTDMDLEIIINNSSFQKLFSNESASATDHQTPSKDQEFVIDVISVGLCVQTENIFSRRFAELYQKIYISFYIISLLAVFALYFFIYRSVAERREWRRKQKSFSHAPMAVSTTTVEAVNNCKNNKDGYSSAGFEHLELAPHGSSGDDSNSGSKANGGGKGGGSGSASGNATTLTINTSAAVAAIKNCGHENGAEASDHNSSAEKKTIRERRDFNFLANIRTAIMLFVVTLVFILSFLPAWLMATNLISFKIIVFYMHYNYNVANPVIYAFMNQSFRKELKRVFQRGTHLLRGG